MTREEDLERKAEEIADEAVRGYERILPPESIAEIRRILIFDLLALESGRATLRRCLDDPQVARSDEISTQPRVKKRGSGAA